MYKEYVAAGHESYTLSPLADEGEGLFTPSEVCFITHEIIARYEKLLSLLHDHDKHFSKKVTVNIFNLN